MYLMYNNFTLSLINIFLINNIRYFIYSNLVQVLMRQNLLLTKKQLLGYKFHDKEWFEKNDERIVYEVLLVY